MPRQARLDSPGTLHHVIVRGIEKRRIVDNLKDQEDFVSGLGGIVKETTTAAIFNMLKRKNDKFN